MSDERRAYFERLAPLLLDGLVRSVRASGMSDADAIAAAMTMLESVQSREPLLVARLMALLYPRADNHYLHEICDAIELYMDASKRRQNLFWISHSGYGTRRDVHGHKLARRCRDTCSSMSREEYRVRATSHIHASFHKRPHS